MAVVTEVFDATRQATLEALCDTFVPSVPSDSEDPLEREFMQRSAADLTVAAQVQGLLGQAMLPEEIEAVGGLLDALEAEGFSGAPVEARTAIVHGFRAADPAAKLGLQQLKALTLLFFYALPDEQGRNPNWELIGYPGPRSAPPAKEKTIAVAQVSGESATLTADVCVVGSGAGGGVIAAQRGGRRQAACSCSRWAPTATRRTSSSSSCRATSSSTTAAGWPRPSPARSRSWPARRSAAAPSSTT